MHLAFAGRGCSWALLAGSDLEAAERPGEGESRGGGTLSRGRGWDCFQVMSRCTHYFLQNGVQLTRQRRLKAPRVDPSQLKKCTLRKYHLPTKQR